MLPLAVLVAACSDYGLADPDEAAAPPVRVEEQFTQAARPALDVLFVVDSTGSMAEELATFSARAGELVEALDAVGLAWQLGVTTADPADGGALVGHPWIVTPEADDPVAAFAAALDVGADSPPPAAGLDAAALALLDADGLNRGFRRDGASLHVVFVSDGDDQSGGYLGDDPVAAVIALLDADAARSGGVARASAVVGDVPDGCKGATGSARAGTRYVEVAEATGGAVVSICRAELRVVADALGVRGVEWPTTFSLQAAPDEGSVVVEVDGARLVDGWTVEGASLVFAEAPSPGALIEVTYTLAGA